MINQIAIGVDIGGSHITSAAVNIDDLKIIPRTTFSVKLNNKASKDQIFENWSQAINKTIESVAIHDNLKLGFAMPGPFHYKTGIARFKGQNDKYASLYDISIPHELIKHLDVQAVDMRFINDATAFGVGASSMGKAKGRSRIIAVTLGTGFGSAFVKNGVPQVVSDDLPKGGCLWDKPYKDSIGDDYFSTRWCIKRYLEFSGIQVKGVKEIADAGDEASRVVFREFGTNMAEFMIPFLHLYRPDLIILGGNVSNAREFFLPTLKSEILEAGLEMDFTISNLMEDAALIGGAKLFDPHFWNQVKKDLPEL